MDLRAFCNIIGDARSGARDDKDFLSRIGARYTCSSPKS